MTSFSERMGYVVPPEFMQLEGMTDELRNLLANFCVDVFNDIRSTQDISFIEKQIKTTLKISYDAFSLVRSDHYSMSTWFDKKSFRNIFESLEWHQRYSIIERLIGYIIEKPHCIASNVELIPYLNTILERENSAYRMDITCEFIPISNENELKEVQTAQDNDYDTVKMHMNKAITLFADRNNHDYANAVKESISAVEALARHLTGQKDGTLGQLIKKLDIHPALSDGISKLYGWAGDDAGIRHSNKDSSNIVDFDTAKLAIVTNSALINFITAKIKNNLHP